MVPMTLPSALVTCASMKVPPKRKGNPSDWFSPRAFIYLASMKVPPKRKGNSGLLSRSSLHLYCLNESPSEKEGKSTFPVR